jgi:hypothetical protein
MRSACLKIFSRDIQLLTATDLGSKFDILIGRIIIVPTVTISIPRQNKKDILADEVQFTLC